MLSISILAGIQIRSVFSGIPVYVFLVSAISAGLSAFVFFKNWERIREVFLDILERYRSFYEDFRESPVTVLEERLRSVDTLVYVIAAAIFIVHFWLQWRYTFRIIHMAGGLAIVKMFNVFLGKGLMGLLDPAFQINNYTGNPLFLLPFVDLLGYSPSAMRITLIASMAASTAIFFLAYYRLFDLKKALLGILLLFSMSEYIYFRWFDYTYVIFLVAVLFYLYAGWRDDQDIRSYRLYIISFVGGIFFYFKATVLYMLAGLAAGVLVLKKKDFLRADFLLLAILFIAGAAPFLVYNIAHMEHIESSVDKSNEVSLSGPEKLNLRASIVARFDQMGRWMRSDIYNLDALWSNSTVFDYNFAPDNPPGGEIFEPLSIRSVLTGEGYDIHPYTGFHLITALLLAGLALITAKSHYVDLAAIFSVFFTLMIFLPSTSGFRAGHMNVLVPFAIPIYLAALDLMPRSLESSRMVKAGYALLMILLIASSVLTVTYLDPVEKPGESPRWSEQHWGGDQGFYQGFDELDTGDDILTNSYKVAVITNYFPDKQGTYLFPSNITEKKLQQLPARVAHPIGTSSKKPLNEIQPGNYNVILHQEMPCTPEEEYCGESTDRLREKLNLTQEMERIELKDETYLIARDLYLR